MDESNIWFPFYIGDFLADTGRLSTEEIGALLLLCLDYFRNGPLPDDERILRQVARLDPAAWSNAWKMLHAFLKPASDGKLHNQKWDAEIASVMEKRLAAKSKAKNAARSRWNKNTTKNASSTSQAMPDSCQSQSDSQSEKANTNTIALTANAVLAGDSSVFIKLPLNDGTEYPITETNIASWEALYRAIDVRHELRKYRGWADAKPKKRKTRRGIQASVNSWLSKAHDEYRPQGGENGTDQKIRVIRTKQERSCAAIQKAAQNL